MGVGVEMGYPDTAFHNHKLRTKYHHFLHKTY